MKALVKPLLYCLALLILIPAGVHAATVHVTAQNFSFTPAVVTISVGDTVTWTFSGGPHTSTSGTNCTADGKWNSGSMSSGSTFSHTFTQAGNFPYFCIPHCGLGMTGTVVVNQAITPAIAFRISAACAGVGTPVTIMAESTLGGQYYKYWVDTHPWCQPGSANYQVIQNWTTAHTAPWTPAEPGIHTVIVWVSNVPADEACEHGQIGATYNVGEGANCTHPVEVTLSPSSGAVNQPVTVTAHANGTNVQYRFWVNNVDFCTGAPNWTLLQDWTTVNTHTFTPTAPGIFTIIVWAATDINDPCPPQGGMVYVVPDGPALYAQHCAACHGPLATSTKRGATVVRIQNAIDNNIGGMGTTTLRALVPVEVLAISTALSP
jgi:plastocyanin